MGPLNPYLRKPPYPLQLHPLGIGVGWDCGKRFFFLIFPLPRKGCHWRRAGCAFGGLGDFLLLEGNDLKGMMGLIWSIFFLFGQQDK